RTVSLGLCSHSVHGGQKAEPKAYRPVHRCVYRRSRGALWLFRVPRGPTCGGKPLSTWLDDWGSVPEGGVLVAADRAKRNQAQKAIQQLGTNSIPSLLRMAGKKDSSLKKKFIALLNKQPLARFRTKPT